MSDIRLKFVALPNNDVASGVVSGARVAYVDGAIGGPERAVSLGALFPGVDFISVGAGWPGRLPANLDVLIVGATLAGVDAIIGRLAAVPQGVSVVVALGDADVASTRRLVRAGAADVLTAPVSEAALALSLERLLVRTETSGSKGETGRIVALLKAGGGVGATALGTQLTAILASQSPDSRVCFADLDVQFGMGALYLDLGDAITLTDILGGGGPLAEAPLATAIARHGSGARLLASPREMTPLESIHPNDVDGLFTALRRDFTTTILDLPTVWTAWTNHALQLCDQVVLVTELSVPHVNLVKRQLRFMAAQGLEAVPLTLVCNRMSADQQAVLSLKGAERALGRRFDVVIPEDRRLMNEAVGQGREISGIRAGSKLENAIRELAAMVIPTPVAQREKRKRLWS